MMNVTAVVGLRDALCELHRELVAAGRLRRERASGEPVAGPAAMLKLLLEDPEFAWLRPLSATVADLDERLAEEEEDVTAVARDSVVALFTPGAFWDRYAPLLQEEPSVAVAHGRVRRALASLPAQQGVLLN